MSCQGTSAKVTCHFFFNVGEHPSLQLRLNVGVTLMKCATFFLLLKQSTIDLQTVSKWEEIKMVNFSR